MWLVVLAACGGPASDLDAGVDSGGNSRDAGSSFDAGAIEDAGVPQDAGALEDAGAIEDAGVLEDAGILEDAGALDGGRLGPLDAGRSFEVPASSFAPGVLSGPPSRAELLPLPGGGVGGPVLTSNNPEVFTGDGLLYGNARPSPTRGGAAYPLSGAFGVYLHHLNRSGATRHVALLVTNPNAADVTVTLRGSGYSQTETGGLGLGSSPDYVVSREWILDRPQTVVDGAVLAPSQEPAESQPPSPTLPPPPAAVPLPRVKSPYELPDAPPSARRARGAAPRPAPAPAPAAAPVDADAMARSWLKRASRSGAPYYVNLGSGASVWEVPEGEIYDVGADGVLLRLQG
jgi:hypothetical protein